MAPAPRGASGGPAGPERLGLLVLAVILVGLTLRSPLVGVPPVLGAISAELAFSPTTAALLTSLPLLAFALLSPAVPQLMRRLGVDLTLLLCLVLLGAAILLRPWVGAAGLLLGTLAVGAAITMGNVVIPVLVRRDAGEKVPQVMAASTSAYGLGQAVAAGAAVPVAVLAGWRWAISLPGVFVVLALVVWVLRMRVVGGAGSSGLTAGRQASGAAGSSGASPAPGAGARAEAGGAVWRESGAWWLAVFFGMQSLLFYTGATWMPAQLVESGGLSEAAAGTALSIFHLIGIAGTLLVPSMLSISGDARIVGAGIGAGWFLFFAGLQTVPELWPLLMVLGGLVQGAGIGPSLTLIAMRPVDLAFGRQLSGMVQGVGYAISATGPVVVGMIHEVTRSWWWGTGMLLLCSSVMVAAAWQAGRSSPLGPEPCPDV
ncbi:MFS transporter [Nesterenkonia sp. K-15-9-6]|uniref:MFS transporter n=1 Tax=Nesterenkonia sp. K-15-9-6 TaxID=3093918 RepID=UPI004044C20F